MTLSKHLEEFYKENNIPIDGGFNDTSFNFKVFGINLKSVSYTHLTLPTTYSV